MPTLNSPWWSEHFSLSYILILILVIHLLGFPYPRYVNSSLTMHECKNQGCRSSGTSTTWICTGTNHVLEVGIGATLVLVSGTGTTLDGTGTILPLHKWYRYHPCLVSVPVAGTDQKWQISPSFIHFSSINLFYSILHQKPTWNPSKTIPQTLIMVV